MRSLVSLALVLGLGAFAGLPAQQRAFPHDQHARLFPLCEGCHLGLPAGDSASFYPEPVRCASCHDGVQQQRVEWRGAVREISNLRFDHVRHAQGVARDGAPLACETCHASAANRMRVEYTIVASCLGCHAHRATQHLADAKCETCHVPLAQTRFTAERILELPIPPSHQQTDFLAGLHGRLAKADEASCTTCHTRERCASCHVNAGQVASIATLPTAPPALADVRWTPKYPKPASHQSPTWTQKHGGVASVESCSTCHTRDDCASCHRTTQPAVVSALPRRSEAAAPGVVTLKGPLAPASHAAPGFVRTHGSLAATSLATCTTCHTRDQCSQCHQSTPLSGPAAAQPASAVAESVRPPSRRATAESRFHLPNFMLRHSASAYARRLECANCHDVRVFCRDCHTQSGLSTAGGSGRLQGAFHDAEPLWLLRHARAARQGLESCTACHTQRDCLQCHSDLGAFRINPHGDNFDARRAQKRNPVICFACHVADPLVGGAPQEM